MQWAWKAWLYRISSCLLFTMVVISIHKSWNLTFMCINLIHLNRSHFPIFNLGAGLQYTFYFCSLILVANSYNLGIVNFYTIKKYYIWIIGLSELTKEVLKLSINVRMWLVFSHLHWNVVTDYERISWILQFMLAVIILSSSNFSRISQI